MTASGEPRDHAGGCLCGAVRYRVSGPLRQVVACHCGQCRRLSGHYMAATAARHSDLTIQGVEHLKWYRSSGAARRGFCATCGAHMFWESDGGDTISIFAGSLDDPTGLRLVEHIFVDDKADYYEIADGLPTRAQGGTEVSIGSS